jgi:hypothetical protein
VRNAVGESAWTLRSELRSDGRVTYSVGTPAVEARQPGHVPVRLRVRAVVGKQDWPASRSTDKIMYQRARFRVQVIEKNS